MDSLSSPNPSSSAVGEPSPHSELSPFTHGSERAKYKLLSPAKLPISRSPCITIPPGLSPTSFLESPVLLSNMKVEPSPTTGSLFKYQIMHSTAGSASYRSRTDCSDSKTFEEERSSCFEFKPHSGSNMVPADSSHQQSQQAVQIQNQCLSQSFTSSATVTNEMPVFGEKSISMPVDTSTSWATPAAEINLDDSIPAGSSTGVQESHSDHKGAGPCNDGYNWRKYGQKLVKGSEFPRSYYKCTHANCEVKKLFERSPDGKITEIIYKGTHDHPKPQPSRRCSAGTVLSTQEDNSASTLAGRDDKSANVYGQTAYDIEPNARREQSPSATNVDTVGAVASQSNRIRDEVGDEDDDDTLSKRRKMDTGGIDVPSIVKPIREPRVVVQTVSEVDILEDGYKWRKYGQKVVRGNPNPRSYYKCTNAGCPVRKHIERASHDPKAVITTYEGKHNHDVPTARTSNRETAGPVSLTGHSRIKSENYDMISLHLGVGINSASEDRSSERHEALHPEAIWRQAHPEISNFKVVHANPVSTYHGVVNSGINGYGSGDQDEKHGIEVSPFNHPHPYPQNMGRILMGP